MGKNDANTEYDGDHSVQLLAIDPSGTVQHRILLLEEAVCTNKDDGHSDTLAYCSLRGA